MLLIVLLSLAWFVCAALIFAEVVYIIAEVVYIIAMVCETISGSCRLLKQEFGKARKKRTLKANRVKFARLYRGGRFYYRLYL